MNIRTKPSLVLVRLWRKKARWQVSLRAKKLLKYQALLLLSALVLSCFCAAKAETAGIVINEVQISGGKGKTTEDYIELYNNSDKLQKIGGWQLKKRINSKKTIDGVETIVASESSIKVFKKDAIIPAKGFYLWANKETDLDFLPDEISTATITSNNSVALLNSDEKIVDQVAWGNGHVDPFIEENAFATVFEKDKAEIIERKDFEDSNNNAEDFQVIKNGSPEASGCLENSEKCVIEEAVKILNKNSSEIKLNIDDDVFVNVYANFEILGLDKKAKVAWTFGDSHRSYLKKTKHKYAEIGKYEASVKYSNEDESIVRNFTVDVGEIPHPKVRIISVNANPKGSDTDNETIVLQNKSKKKINLNGWSIATGWKSMMNHPISEDFIIKGGKEKEITREISKFTLNNKKTKIELRYPDGEVADKMKYKSEKGIGEDEVYAKVKGKWMWELSQKSIKSIKSESQNKNSGLVISNESSTINNQQEVVEEIVEEDVMVQSEEDKIPEILLLSNKYVAKIEPLENQPRVLGAMTVREIDDQYFFTPEMTEPDHYAVAFAKNVFVEMNEKINILINLFFE